MPQFPFDRSLTLFQYILSLFGTTSLSSLCHCMKEDYLEGFDEQNISHFHTHLTNVTIEYPGISAEQLLAYDHNIVSHTLKIMGKREDFRWKYFQYMGLLFTEIYLDNYFSNPQKLLDNLNHFVDRLNKDRSRGEFIDSYTMDDLNKVAYWQATGSGKTLIMHVNILQYHHYLTKHGLTEELNKTVLLTPNEGLSTQHKEEFELSGMQADLFDKDSSGAFLKNDIEIIDIHKLKDESKEKTVSVDCFEGNNLVLVDEGHRGASGNEWMDKRNRLCADGFSFEYSATFGQAVRGKRELEQLYAKCILFDYSYKFFYQDGYGKKYSILNLAEVNFDEQKQLYLTACLLTFYQQLKIFEETEQSLNPYNIEEPLWVFVGSKVNAVRTERGQQVSDVVDILLFVKRFIHNDAETIGFIERLLNGDSQLNDTRGIDLFAGKFKYLIASGLTAESIFADIRKRVFNCDISDAELHLDNLKGVQGEIGLKLGDNDYFGVINVGDDSKLLRLCEDNGLFSSDRDFAESLFDKINKEHSTVKLLIGSKKFTEGWNSWRVSTMGLMNVGRSEGSEIIQLFGRGVRLKGYNMSLKRSSSLIDISPPQHIEPVETLHIFGVRADYMKQFRDYLDNEGVKNDDDYEKIVLPVISNLGSYKLKYPQLKEGVNFKKDVRPVLDNPPDYILEHPIKVDWYPKIEALQSQGILQGSVAQLKTAKLQDFHIAFMDFDAIYFEVQKHKNERSYYNLNINKDILAKLLKRPDWYELYIPSEDMEFRSFEQVRMWQEIAVTLLKKYCDQYFTVKKLEHEKDKMEYKYLHEVEAKIKAQEKQGNLFDEYVFVVEKSREDIITKLTDLKQKIANNDFSDFPFERLVSFEFNKHLYKPIIYIGKNSEITVTPVALNDGEKTFVTDLKDFYTRHTDFFTGKEMFLLRNLGRGRGVGFFQEYNFYPDFILWLVQAGKQYITFIDPHGCGREKGFDAPKIRFHKEIKSMQNQIGDPDVILNSFIVSVTSYQQIKWWGKNPSDKNSNKHDFEDHHVLFQEDGGIEYIQKMFDKLGDDSILI